MATAATEAPAELTPAETATAAQSKARELKAQAADLDTQLTALTAKQQALEAGQSQALDQVQQAHVVVRAAEGELTRARAVVLIDAVRGRVEVATAERGLATAQAALEAAQAVCREASTRAAGRLGVITKARDELIAKKRELSGLVDALIAEAQAAHTAFGQERLAALQTERQAIVDRLTAAAAEFAAAYGDLEAFVSGAFTRLEPWSSGALNTEVRTLAGTALMPWLEARTFAEGGDVYPAVPTHVLEVHIRLESLQRAQQAQQQEQGGTN
jgi:hypothetical protein